MQQQSSESTGQTCQSTTMCGRSRRKATGASTSSAADSPAKTSAMQARKSASQDCEVGCGQSSPGLLARYDRVSSLWKTSQRCLFEALETFSGRWPRSGMTRNGIAYRLPQLVPLSSAIGCGLLPTLVAGDSKGSRNGTATGRSLSDGITLTDWLWLNVEQGTLSPGSAEQMRGFPLGWTALDASETPSSRKSSKSLAGQSLKRKQE